MTSPDAMRPAHHKPGGGFRNPWPGGERQPASGLVRWMLQRLRHGRPEDPPASVFDVATPSFASRGAAGEIAATWVGHSTVLVQLGALNVLTDPVWSSRASPVPFAGPKRWVAPGVALGALPPIDLVLLSHNHYDHCDVPTLRALARAHPAARWRVPLGMLDFVRRLGARDVAEHDWWGEETLPDGTRLGCTPAQHFSARGPFDQDRTLWCGWTVRNAAGAFFFAGDSGLHPEFGEIARRFGPFDLCAIPAGAYEPRWFMRPVHMNADEAVLAWQAVRAAHPHTLPALLPVHWGTFKLTDEPMDEPPRRVRALWADAGLPGESLWLLRHGETRRMQTSST